jgi:hypothetical protein
MAISETARLIASLELKDLFSKQVGNVEKSLNHLDKKIDQTASRSFRAGQQIGNGIKNATRIIAAAAISAATISAGVFALAIKKASDLSETVNKVGVVFKNQTPRVLAFGKDAASSMGLTEQAALEAAATFGNLFTAMKLPVAKSAEMSDKLVQLASDLASFNNIDPTEALQKLQSGLTGQFRPLKELGVNIDQAAIKQEAFRLGLIKTTKTALTPAIKAQAAYSLIFQQTKTAQGDFARTSGGLANQVRILKANFDDLLASLGTAALPGVAKIFVRINAAIKENAPAIAKLGDAIGSLFSDANINQGAAFIENMLKTAMAAAPILIDAAKATAGFVSEAVSVFNTLPPELKGLLVGGFALNKLTGGLVTNVAGGIAGSILGVIKGSRGSSPANPVFVSDATKGLTGAAGGAAAAAEAGAPGLISKAIGLLPATFFATGILAAAVPIGQAISAALPDWLKGPGGAGKSQSQLAREAADQAVAGAANAARVASNTAPFGTHQTFVPTVKLDASQVRDLRPPPVPAPFLLDRGGRESGVRAPIFLPGDTRSEGRAQGPASVQSVLTRAISLLMAQGGLQKAFILSLHGEFRDAFKLLAKANSAQQIKDAIKAINKITFDKGIGGSGGAAATEKTLKGLLIKFPSLASILVPEIRKVHAKMLGRQFEEAEFRKFDKIFKSNEDSKHKIADLQKIAKAVGARDDANGKRLQARVDALKAATIAQAAATRKTIAANDPRIYLTIPVENRVVVNARQVQATAAIFSRVFGGTPTGTRAPRGG